MVNSIEEENIAWYVTIDKAEYHNSVSVLIVQTGEKPGRTALLLCLTSLSLRYEISSSALALISSCIYVNTDEVLEVQADGLIQEEYRESDP